MHKDTQQAKVDRGNKLGKSSVVKIDHAYLLDDQLGKGLSLVNGS